MFYDYHSNTIQSSLIREKILPRLLKFNLNQFDFTLKSARIFFLLKNSFDNRNLFFTMILILERFMGVKFSFLKSKDTVVGFNIKEDMIFGATYTLSSHKLNQFMKNFVDNSLKKLNSYTCLYHEKPKYFSLEFKDEQVKFGLEQVLFNASSSLSRRDYELFFPVFERITAGVYIHLYSNYRNFLVNRLILSQYGLVIN